MNGYGRLFDRHNRLLFEGDFLDNEYEGIGILHNPSADQGSLNLDDFATPDLDWRAVCDSWTKYEGLFKSGRFHGTGYLHFGARNVLISAFEEGRLGREVFVRELPSGNTRRLGEDSHRELKSN